MKIILIKNIEKLGKKYDIIHVNDGYARNFLIPNKYAVLFTLGRFRHVTDILNQQKNKKIFLLTKYKNIIEKIKKLKLTIALKTSIHGKLYGSFNIYDILDILLKKDIKIDKKDIKILKPIKSVGKHEIRVVFNKQESIYVNFFINIISS